ncbi:MAG TPA: BrnT family toxin [Rhizomicrobium sp.]
MAKTVRGPSSALDGNAAHMIFEWDEEKSRTTFDIRQFDFAFAVRVFVDSRRLERIDRRQDYGEERRQTIGEIDGKTYLVVFTQRKNAIRIISARRAHDNEDAAYRKDQVWR